MSDRPDHIGRILGSDAEPTEQANAPGVTLDLLAHLEARFPPRRAASYTGADYANNAEQIALNVARQEGREEVLSYLKILNQAQTNR